jgi:hypothetical protein
MQLFSVCERKSSTGGGAMHRFFSACAIVTALTVAASAQDTTIKSKTKVDADDAKVVTMTGCLQSGTGEVFTLTDAKAVAGEDLEARTKTKIDVDKDETEVKTKSRTEVEHEDDEKPVGTAGAVTTYELMPKDGVNLTPHVGHRVEITAVALDKKDGDDDAEIDIQTRTKIEREDAPDSKVKSKTEAELPRGAHNRLTVVSVKHVAPTCTM